MWFFSFRLNWEQAKHSFNRFKTPQGFWILNTASSSHFVSSLAIIFMICRFFFTTPHSCLWHKNWRLRVWSGWNESSWLYIWSVQWGPGGLPASSSAEPYKCWSEIRSDQTEDQQTRSRTPQTRGAPHLYRKYTPSPSLPPSSSWLLLNQHVNVCVPVFSSSRPRLSAQKQYEETIGKNFLKLPNVSKASGNLKYTQTFCIAVSVRTVIYIIHSVIETMLINCLNF